MVFLEKQRFSQWWLWIILLPVVLIPLYGIYYQMILGKPFGNNPMPDIGLIIYAVLSMAFAVAFFMVRLVLRVDEKGMVVRFFPLLRREVNWEEVDHYEIVDYGFVGGYGIRLTSKYGTVYNTRGRKGLLIHLKSGKRFCVGTQRSKELKEVVKAYMTLQHDPNHAVGTAFD